MPEDKKCKVLHIITRLDPGGSTINTLETVARLDPLRYEADLLAGRTDDPSGMAAAFVDRRRIRCRFVPELVRDFHPWSDLVAFFRIYGVIRQGKYDLVHTHCSKAGILGRWAAFAAGVRKIVHTPHGHVFYGYFPPLITGIFIFLERITACVTTRLIALTENGIREHLAFGVGRPGQWRAVYSGIDVAAFVPSVDVRRDVRKEFGFSDTDVVCISVARLDPVKNHDVLIRALAFAAKDHPGLKLLLVGDGPDKEKLFSQAEAEGVAGRIVFAGFRADIGRMLNAGDIFVLASRNEGMGRAVLEAMAMGLAVVVSRVGGLPALVDDGKEGLLVPAQDDAAWAAALVRLGSGPSLRQDMGRAARQRVNEQFGLGRMVRSIEEVYQQL